MQQDLQHEAAVLPPGAVGSRQIMENHARSRAVTHGGRGAVGALSDRQRTAAFPLEYANGSAFGSAGHFSRSAKGRVKVAGWKKGLAGARW